MMNTIKFDVEEAIKDNVYAVTKIIADYYKEEGYAMTKEEIQEVHKILENIKIMGWQSQPIVL